jgi:hypothetical protein
MLLWISLNTRKCYLGGSDQALEFLEGREPRLSNFNVILLLICIVVAVSIILLS